MVIVEGGRGPWHDRLAFFPSSTETQALHDDLPMFGTVRIRQTEAILPPSRRVVRSGTFRTSRVDLGRDEDSLFGDVHKTARNEIRRISAMGERVRLAGNDASVARDFLALYNGFVAAKGHHYPMSERRLAEYLAVSDVWVAFADGHPTIGRLFVRDAASKRVRFLYEGNRRFERGEEARLNGMLGRWFHWELICRYRAGGMEAYDMGGIGDGSGSVASYKLSLGGVRVEDHSYVLARRAGSLGFHAFEGLERGRASARKVVRSVRE
jgi:hypothetical protein